MSADLVTRATARELAAAFEQAERAVRESFARIVAAEERLGLAFGLAGSDRIRIDAAGGWRDNFRDPEAALRRMRREAWRVIVERLELRRFMSIKRWESLAKEMDDGEPPPITEESVMAFANGFLAEGHAMVREAITEVFEWLRPHEHDRTSKLKTNSQLEIGERVILSYSVERAWSGKGFRVHYQRSQRLIALENVLHGLDGAGNIAKNNRSALETAIEVSPDGHGETDLFEFRCFKNGHLHLRFKRLDLLARFNQVAGGAHLRPAPPEEDRLRAEIAKAKAENERLKKAAGRAA